MINLDNSIKISMIDEQVNVLDSAIASLQKNVDEGHLPKEGSPLFENKLSERISQRNALLQLKQSVQEET